jgi:hypothetical protein
MTFIPMLETFKITSLPLESKVSFSLELFNVGVVGIFWDCSVKTGVLGLAWSNKPAYVPKKSNGSVSSSAKSMVSQPSNIL